jgi:hypothetical protein
MEQPEAHQIPPVSDPDHVPETFANGPMNCIIIGSVAQLTFTNIRPSANDLLKGSREPAIEAVVRARIVIPTEILPAIRDVLNNVLGQSGPQKSGTATTSQLH